MTLFCQKEKLLCSLWDKELNNNYTSTYTINLNKKYCRYWKIEKKTCADTRNYYSFKYRKKNIKLVQNAHKKIKRIYIKKNHIKYKSSEKKYVSRGP